LAPFIADLAKFCKKPGEVASRESFVQALGALATCSHKHEVAAGALMVGLGQAVPLLLNDKELEELALNLQEKRDDLGYRRMPDGTKIYTATWLLDQPTFIQIECLSLRSTERRLCLIMTLALLVCRQRLVPALSKLGGSKKFGASFVLTDQSGYERNVGPLPPDALTAERPSVVFELAAPPSDTERASPVMIPIVIHDSFDDYADLSQHPENKALAWLLTTFFASVLAELTGNRRDPSADMIALEMVAELLGYKKGGRTSQSAVGQQFTADDVEQVLSTLRDQGK